MYYEMFKDQVKASGHLKVPFLNSQLVLSHVNCAYIDFFFLNIDADNDFFHTFALGKW